MSLLVTPPASSDVPLDRLLTVRQVADHLQVTVRTVRRWIANGDLVAMRTRTGGVVRIAPAALQRFLATDPVNGDASARKTEAHQEANGVKATVPHEV